VSLHGWSCGDMVSNFPVLPRTNPTDHDLALNSLVKESWEKELVVRAPVARALAASQPVFAGNLFQ